jgi:formamidopyrimidine-DNA glycosylase
MPELPEVETICQDLRERVIGATFSNVTLNWSRSVHTPSPREFCQRLVGRTILGISRRGKYLLFDLTGGDLLIAHLRMTGQLLYRTDPEEEDPYVTAIFELSNGHVLRLADVRKFADLWLVTDAQQVTSKLGLEPLEQSFGPMTLAPRLLRRGAPIKPLLCDQTVIAGIGNVYADEALFAARIHPLRPARSLNPEELVSLCDAIQGVLSRAIVNRGTSFRDYRDAEGQEGSNQHALKVYRREHLPCLSCGTLIRRIPVRGRSSYFCPHCQQAGPT